MLLSSMTLSSTPWYVSVLAFVLTFYVTITLLAVVAAAKNYFISKTAYYKNREQEVKHIAYTQMAIGTMDALLVIDKLIDIEVARLMDLKILEGVPFNILHMDKDIEATADSIYKSFRADYFKKISEDILVLDFWHNYIIDQTSLRLMKGYQRVNAELIQRQPAKG